MVFARIVVHCFLCVCSYIFVCSVVIRVCASGVSPKGFCGFLVIFTMFRHLISPALWVTMNHVTIHFHQTPNSLHVTSITKPVCTVLNLMSCAVWDWKIMVSILLISVLPLQVSRCQMTFERSVVLLLENFSSVDDLRYHWTSQTSEVLGPLDEMCAITNVNVRIIGRRPSPFSANGFYSLRGLL